MNCLLGSVGVGVWVFFFFFFVCLFVLFVWGVFLWGGGGVVCFNFFIFFGLLFIS